MTLNSSAEVRERAPSAYGVYSVVYDGRVIANQFTARRELLAQPGAPNSAVAG